MEINSFSHGKGKIFCTLKGYDLCHNAEKVISENAYDSENDTENPTGSIFCAHGAGYYVDWSRVADFAHVEDNLTESDNSKESIDQLSQNIIKKISDFGDMVIAQEEIDEIFARTFGNAKKKRNKWGRRVVAHADNAYKGTDHACLYLGEKEYLLVDGYNIICAW